MDSVNKIEGGKGMDYKVVISRTSGEVADTPQGQPVGPVHNDKIVMRNNIQTYTGVGQVPADSQEQMNTFEDILGEDLQGDTEGKGGPIQ